MRYPIITLRHKKDPNKRAIDWELITEDYNKLNSTELTEDEMKKMKKPGSWSLDKPKALGLEHEAINNATLTRDCLESLTPTRWNKPRLIELYSEANGGRVFTEEQVMYFKFFEAETKESLWQLDASASDLKLQEMRNQFITTKAFFKTLINPVELEIEHITHCNTKFCISSVAKAILPIECPRDLATILAEEWLEDFDIDEVVGKPYLAELPLEDIKAVLNRGSNSEWIYPYKGSLAARVCFHEFLKPQEYTKKHEEGGSSQAFNWKLQKHLVDFNIEKTKFGMFKHNVDGFLPKIKQEEPNPEIKRYLKQALTTRHLDRRNAFNYALIKAEIAHSFGVYIHIRKDMLPDKHSLQSNH